MESLCSAPGGDFPHVKSALPPTTDQVHVCHLGDVGRERRDEVREPLGVIFDSTSRVSFHVK